MKLRQYDIKKYNGIVRWDEAIPLGNGLFGALLYGTDSVKMALDRTDLWDIRPVPELSDPNFNYKTLIQLVKSGTQADWDQYVQLFDKFYQKNAYPSKITAGRLEFKFDQTFIPNFSLSLEQAVATVTDESGKIRMKAFTSATEFVGAIRIWGDYNIHYHTPSYICNESETDSATNMGYPPTEVILDGSYTYYLQKTHTDFKYGILLFETKTETWNELYFTLITNATDDLDEAKKQISPYCKAGI